MTTHDHPTKLIPPADLDSTHVLVGESGGLCAIYDNDGNSNVMPGLIRLETEHGPLYLDPDEPAPVLDLSPREGVMFGQEMAVLPAAAPQRTATIKRRYAVMLEDAIEVALPDDVGGESEIDLDEWALENFDRLYTTAVANGIADAGGLPRMLWEDQHRADLDFPEGEIVAEVTR